VSADTASFTPPARARGLVWGDARFALLTALGIALFPFLLHLLGGYSTLATQIAIVSIASIGFNLLLGYAGILSYGHAMFYGGGGYIAAIPHPAHDADPSESMARGSRRDARHDGARPARRLAHGAFVRDLFALLTSRSRR